MTDDLITVGAQRLIDLDAALGAIMLAIMLSRWPWILPRCLRTSG
jgi:hypothetical protein